MNTEGEKKGENMKNRGITLVELIVSISIIGILLVLSYLWFADWMARYRVEKATRELYADMMHARMDAISRSMDHYMVMDPASYTMYEDKNEDGDPDAGEELQTYPKKVEYVLDWNNKDSKTITFDKRGFVTPNRTVWFMSGAKPDCDCMRISRTRIIMGRFRYKEDGTADECKID